jgi:capsular polysaccharide biosynthesis protein
MENQEKTSYAENTLKKVLTVIRKNLIFIIIVCILASFAGACFSKLRKPVYTATAKASYYAEVNDKNGEVNPASSVNAMKAYFETVVDYCKTGCVLDRADFYYSQFLQAKQSQSDLSLNEFFDKINAGEYQYTVDELAQRKHFFASIIISGIIEGDAQFLFKVSLKADDQLVARQKLRVLIFAFNEEIEYSFGGVKSSINEFVANENEIECYSNVSLVRDLLIGFGIGVGLALVLLYVRELFDNTVKEKEDLEEITGATLLAYIEKEGGNKND